MCHKIDKKCQKNHNKTPKNQADLHTFIIRLRGFGLVYFIESGYSSFRGYIVNIDCNIHDDHDNREFLVVFGAWLQQNRLPNMMNLKNGRRNLKDEIVALTVNFIKTV
jgi:hypothetical protein